MAVAGVTVAPELLVIGVLGGLGGCCLLVWLLVAGVSLSVSKSRRPQPDKFPKANVSEVGH